MGTAEAPRAPRAVRWRSTRCTSLTQRSYVHPAPLRAAGVTRASAVLVVRLAGRAAAGRAAAYFGRAALGLLRVELLARLLERFFAPERLPPLLPLRA